MNRGGGFNAENSQVSDGRRLSPRKCRDCDNAVHRRGSRLCVECNLRAFDARRERTRERARNAARAKAHPPLTTLEEFSLGLIGLQRSWLSPLYL